MTDRLNDQPQMAVLTKATRDDDYVRAIGSIVASHSTATLEIVLAAGR